MVRMPLVPVALIVAATLAGCAAQSSPTLRADSASASASEHLRSLAGRWHGTLWETGAWYHQGYSRIELTLHPDGTWTGAIGKAKAQGTARMQGTRLILDGITRSATGDEDPVYFALTGDETRRWGETLGRFGDREERASVSLRKAG